MAIIRENSILLLWTLWSLIIMSLLVNGQSFSGSGMPPNYTPSENLDFDIRDSPGPNHGKKYKNPDGTYAWVDCDQILFDSEDKMKIDIEEDSHMFKKPIGKIGVIDLPKNIDSVIEKIGKDNSTMENQMGLMKTMASKAQSLKCGKCDKLIGICMKNSNKEAHNYISVGGTIKFIARN